MRLGKRERAARRLAQAVNSARRARVARAGKSVYMFSSNTLIARGVPVGRPSFQWGWRWTEHVKAVKNR